MPTFEITAPDGRRFRVEAPEGASQEDVLAYVQQQTAPAQTAAPAAPAAPAGGSSVVGNVAGAAARGLSNFVGLPADAAELAGRGAAYLGQFLPAHPGVTPEMASKTGAMYDATRFATPPAAPTSTAVRGVMRDAGVPVDARAESTGGRIVQGAIEGALSFPANPAALAYGALSGGSAEAAGEGVAAIGGNETAQTIARTAAGFAAPLAAGQVVGMRAAAQARPPTAEAIKAAGQDAYQRASSAGVVVGAPSLTNVIDDIASMATREGIDPILQPSASRALARLQEAKGADLTLDQVDTLRKVVQTAAGSQIPSERRMAAMMIEKIDDFVAGLKPADVVAGNVDDAVPALQEARQLWSRARKGEQIDELIERAQTRASQFSGSGYENALRTEFRNLAMNPKQMRRFDATEQRAIKAVAMGGPLENSLRLLGKLAPTGVVSGALGGGAGYALGGPVGAGAVVGTGLAARAGATALTERNAQRASEVMRAGRAIPAASPSREAVLSALLSAERELAVDPRISGVPRDVVPVR